MNKQTCWDIFCFIFLFQMDIIGLAFGVKVSSFKANFEMEWGQDWTSQKHSPRTKLKSRV